MMILLFFMFFCLGVIGQSVWVFVSVIESTRWGCLALILIGIGCILPVFVLYGFHLYLSCCVDLRTIEFIQSEKTEKFPQ